MEKRELYDKLVRLISRRFMMMASIFAQIFMVNVVIIMKPVASVRNCCTEIKDAGSKEF